MGDLLHDVSQLRSISSIAFLVLLLAWESLAPFGSYFVGKPGERLLHGRKESRSGNSECVVHWASFCSAVVDDC